MQLNMSEMALIRDSITREMANKCDIKIERKRKSLHLRLLMQISSIATGWPVLCLYITVLSIASVALVLYLKLNGELMAFCLYDNWLYLAYYCLLTAYSASMIACADFDVFHIESQFWKWYRRVGAYVWFFEIQGFAYIVVYYKDLVYDLEYDDEAQVIVWSLVSIGVLRLFIVSLLYWVGSNALQSLISKNKMTKNYYGNTLTDFADLFAIELILLSIYLYSFSLISICFSLSITGFYFAFARV